MSDKTKKFDTTDILKNKSYAEPSVFQPTNLLRESRRQNEIPLGKVPSVCILDPDGNLVDYLQSKNGAIINKYWACYHSVLYTFKISEITVGIILMEAESVMFQFLTEWVLVEHLSIIHC